MLSLQSTEQWKDLPSPLDVFARKHCPARVPEDGPAYGPTAGGAPPAAGGVPLSRAPWEPCDRPHNSSPLAALLQREFPAGAPAHPDAAATAAAHAVAHAATGRPQPERRLFDDL